MDGLGAHAGLPPPPGLDVGAASVAAAAAASARRARRRPPRPVHAPPSRAALAAAHGAKALVVAAAATALALRGAAPEVWGVLSVSVWALYILCACWPGGQAVDAAAVASAARAARRAARAASAAAADGDAAPPPPPPPPLPPRHTFLRPRARGLAALSPWDVRQALWGCASAALLANFALVYDRDFRGWADVFYFCGARFQYCGCGLRWNVNGWTKAAILWNFALSAALGVQKLVITAGLGGLLPGEEVVTRESFISVAWRLVPYWLNAWEQAWGAECASMMFELPHFAAELLVVLPVVQVLCARLKILALPPGRGAAAAAAAAAATTDARRTDEAAGRPSTPPPPPLLAPNILAGTWEADPAQARLVGRARANSRVVGAVVAAAAAAAFNALVVPLALESAVLAHPRTAPLLAAGAGGWLDEGGGRGGASGGGGGGGGGGSLLSAPPSAPSAAPATAPSSWVASLWGGGGRGEAVAPDTAGASSTTTPLPTSRLLAAAAAAGGQRPLPGGEASPASGAAAIAATRAAYLARGCPAGPPGGRGVGSRRGGRGLGGEGGGAPGGGPPAPTSSSTGGGGAAPPLPPILASALRQHAAEITKMRLPEHTALVPLVEAALALMRLACEKFFVLAAVLAAHLLFRDDVPRPARALIRATHRLSSAFQRVILYSFPAVCWVYGAGVVFSAFVSVVFWGAPAQRAWEAARKAATVVRPMGLRDATAAQVERANHHCAVCWGEMGGPAAVSGGGGRGGGGVTGSDAAGASSGTDGGGVAGAPPSPTRRAVTTPRPLHAPLRLLGAGLGGSGAGGAALGRVAARLVGAGGGAGAAAAAGGRRTPPRSGPPGKALPCGHAFHEACIRRWLAQCHGQGRRPTCPMCNALIALEVTYRLPLLFPLGGGGGGGGGAVRLGGPPPARPPGPAPVVGEPAGTAGDPGAGVGPATPRAAPAAAAPPDPLPPGPAVAPPPARPLGWVARTLASLRGRPATPPPPPAAAAPAARGPPPSTSAPSPLADTREAIVAGHFAALVAAGPALGALAARSAGDASAGGPPGEAAEARVARAREIHAAVLAWHRAASMRAALGTATAARAASRAAEAAGGPGGAAAAAEAEAARAELAAIRGEVDDAAVRRDAAFDFLREAIEAAAAAPPPPGGEAGPGPPGAPANPAASPETPRRSRLARLLLRGG